MLSAPELAAAGTVQHPAAHHYRHHGVPAEGTHHHSHTTVRHYSTGTPALPRAGAVGTTVGKTLSWQGGNNFNGQPGLGVTSGKPKVYLVLWGSQWGNQSVDANGNLTLSNDYDGAAPVAQNLFKGLGTAGERWSGVMTQYCDGPTVAKGATSCPAGAPHIGYPTGGVLAGVWYDNAAAEPATATGSDLENEALAAATHFGNATPASNRYAQYVILSAPGTNPANYKAGGAGCAYHGAAWSMPMQDPVAFTNQPYNMDTNFCGKNFLTAGAGGTLDGYTMTLGHEYAETITDQYPSAGWFTSGAADGGENADHCVWSAGSAYVKMATGSFAMQPTWSNDTNKCEMAHVIVGAANTVTVTNPGSQTGAVGTAKHLQLVANDSAGAALTYSATGLPAGLAINTTSGLVSGTPTSAGSYAVTVKAADSTGASGSASFTWTVSPAPTVCTGQKLANPGFETGAAAPWTASSGVISNTSSMPAHSGSWDAWLDGYGSSHTDTLAQTLTIPAGCKATLSFWLHIDTDEDPAGDAYDTMTVTAGSRTLASYSNLDAANGYVQRTFDLSSLAGQTVTISFTGTEDYSNRTSFVVDDTAVNLG